MAFSDPRTVVASAARTASGDSGSVGVFDAGQNVSLLVDVTAVSGTSPTLDLSVEWSHDDGTTWAAGETADTFAQITATKTTVKSFTVKAPHYRIVWTVGGTTPSFTFSVSQFTT